MYSDTSKTRSSEWIGDLAVWLVEHAGTNDPQMDRMRRNLQLARQQVLTPRQRQILDLYFDEGMNIPAIARELHVNASTISRSLASARRKLYQCLRYSL